MRALLLTVTLLAALAVTKCADTNATAASDTNTGEKNTSTDDKTTSGSGKEQNVTSTGGAYPAQPSNNQTAENITLTITSTEAHKEEMNITWTEPNMSTTTTEMPSMPTTKTPGVMMTTTHSPENTTTHSSAMVLTSLSALSLSVLSLVLVC